MYTVHYSKSDICKERKNIYISRKLQFPASLVFFVKIYTKSLRLWYIYWEINKPASVFFFFLKLNFLLWYILQQEWQNEEWVPPKFIPKLLLLMQVKKWRDSNPDSHSSMQASWSGKWVSPPEPHQITRLQHRERILPGWPPLEKSPCSFVDKHKGPLPTTLAWYLWGSEGGGGVIGIWNHPLITRAIPDTAPSPFE